MLVADTPQPPLAYQRPQEPSSGRARRSARTIFSLSFSNKPLGAQMCCLREERRLLGSATALQVAGCLSGCPQGCDFCGLWKTSAILHNDAPTQSYGQSNCDFRLDTPSRRRRTSVRGCPGGRRSSRRTACSTPYLSAPVRAAVGGCASATLRFLGRSQTASSPVPRTASCKSSRANQCRSRNLARVLCGGAT